MVELLFVIPTAQIQYARIHIALFLALVFCYSFSPIRIGIYDGVFTHTDFCILDFLAMLFIASGATMVEKLFEKFLWFL